MPKLDNYKILFGLKIAKSILAIFVDSFLVLYFLKLSNNNILPLGIYKLVAMSVVFITIFLLRNISKSKNRINLLRIGIILEFVYFIAIILLREKIIDYIYIIGILYGLEEGFYYSVYNMFESDGVSNNNRAKFMGQHKAFSSFLGICFPLIFGGLIATAGFYKSIFLVMLIVVFSIVISFIFKDKNIPKADKTDFKNYINKIKTDKKIKFVYKINILNGLTYSSGAFQSIVMIYIIKIFNNSFSLGIVTSIFSVVTCILGILFSKYIKKKQYKNIIMISMTFTITSLCIMLFNCNIYTVILFNFFQTISKEMTNLINVNSQANLSNLKVIKQEYKVEYFIGIEFFLFIGRVISQSLFILMAFVNELFIIPIFIIFLILLAYNSIKLQNTI